MGARDSFHRVFPLLFFKKLPSFILVYCSFSSSETLTGHLLTTFINTQLLFGGSDCKDFDLFIYFCAIKNLCWVIFGNRGQI